MPCGQFDRRRGGHRCAACRKAHRRCDGTQGRRTCTYCRTRFMECSYVPRHVDQLQMVQVAGPPPRAIIVDSWRFTTAYFEEACGSLPPFAVLRSKDMVALSQADGDVSRVASLVGEVYLCRIRGEEAYLRQRSRLQEMALAEGKVLLERFEDGKETPLAPPLACGIMLVTIHIMLFGNADPCQWMVQASDFIRRRTRDRDGVSYIETDLIRLLQLIDVVNSIARLQEPWAHDFASVDCAGENQTTLHSAAHSPLLLGEESDCILSAMWQWAVLQRRMIKWVAGVSTQTQFTIEQKISGIAIICDTTSLQRKLLDTYTNMTKESDSKFQLLASYSYWTLISISQHLQHAKWALLGCDLPSMTVENVYHNALRTLDCMDTMISQAGLCVGVLLPVIFSVGHEMVNVAERKRVLAMLDNQESRGFELSGHFRDALEGLWGMLQEFGGAVKAVDFMPCYLGMPAAA